VRVLSVANEPKVTRRRVERWTSWIALVALMTAIVASAIDAGGPAVVPLLAVGAVALIIAVLTYRIDRGRI
jgi:hypothetical protein